MLSAINVAARCAAARIGRGGGSPQRSEKANRCAIETRKLSQSVRRIIEHPLTLDKAVGRGGA